MFEGKAIIFSAPSGSGKTTVVRHLMNKFPNLGFSISATTRKKRNGETDGKDYYFLSRREFEEKIANDEFVEWEQVYEGLYYGTLKREVERLWNQNQHVLFDVDVLGGINLKKYFGERGFAVFVKVPDLRELENRLRLRKTESEESLQKRLDRVRYEIGYEKDFDASLVNDKLDDTFLEAEKMINKFLRQ